MIIKIILFMIVFMLLDIKIEDVGAVYVLLATIILVIASILFITIQTVDELNKRLTEKKKKEVEKE